MKYNHNNHPSPGQHLSLQIIENLQTILDMRPNTRVNIQWVPGHAEVLGNEMQTDVQSRLQNSHNDHDNHSRQLPTSKDKFNMLVERSGNLAGKPIPKALPTVTLLRDCLNGVQSRNQQNSPVQTKQLHPPYYYYYYISFYACSL